jgi:hypothetical protein
VSDETVSAFRGEVYLAIARLIVRPVKNQGQKEVPKHAVCLRPAGGGRCTAGDAVSPLRPSAGESAALLGYAYRNLADPLLPLAGPGLVDRGSARVDRHRHRHVLDLELVDRLHAEVGEGDHA